MVKVVDVDDTNFTYEFSDPRFEIVSGELRTKAAFDYEIEKSINVSITATDSGGNSVARSLVLPILDVNEPPTSLTIPNYVLYRELQQQVVGTLTLVDPDVGQSHIFESLDARFLIAAGNQLKLANGSAIAADVSQVIVPIRVRDTTSSPLTADLQLTLQTTAMVSPWKNPRSPLDVIPNDLISPSDALAIINFLNSGASRALNSATTPPLATGPFLDTSGDRLVSPSDALLVINWLNSRRGGEGEAAPSVEINSYPQLAPTKELHAQFSDRFFAFQLVAEVEACNSVPNPIGAIGGRDTIEPRTFTTDAALLELIGDSNGALAERMLVDGRTRNRYK